MAAGDIYLKRAAAATFTLTAASLATSSTRVAGRQSTPITTGDFMDYLVGGKVTTGTTPTISKLIQLWVFASFDDTPTYPDAFSTADANRSVLSENVRDAELALGWQTVIDNTNDRTYWIRPFSIAALYDGNLPKAFGLWLVHDTAANLNSTGSNHSFTYTPVYGFQA